MKDSVKLPNGKILIKKNRIEENSSTRVKSALFNRGNKIRTFAILTAENPLGERQSSEKNNEDMKRLKKELKTLHLNYIKVLGMYGNKEHSVMIVNLSYDDAENLAGMFLQDSFIFGDDNGIRYYKIDRPLYEKTGEIKYDLLETSNRVDTLQDPTVEYNFEYSIQEGRTSRSRTESRILAFKKKENK